MSTKDLDKEIEKDFEDIVKLNKIINILTGVLIVLQAINLVAVLLNALL